MFGPLLAAYLTACSADGISGVMASRAGAHEAVFGGSETVVEAQLAGTTAASVWGLRRLHRTHPRLSIALTVGFTVGHTWAAVHNARLTK